MSDLMKYSVIIFDSDGVILNSNSIKSNAFFYIGSLVDEEYGELLLDYHKRNGGISRYKKIEWFLGRVENNRSNDFSFDFLIEEFSKKIVSQLLDCEVSQGVYTLYDKYQGKQLMVVSGSDQAELRSVYSSKKLDAMFGGHIYGSPMSKYEIFDDLKKRKGLVANECVYIGDSEYDYEAASYAGFDFIFVEEWSEYEAPYAFENDCSVRVVGTLSDLE